jgi:membrane protease YdiL (CAAX protease family)
MTAASTRAVGRKSIVTFLSLTLLFSAIVYALAAFIEVFRGTAYVFVMWAPGVAALVTMRISGRSWRELGWGWGKTRYQVLSLVLPIGVSTIVYGLAWTLGIAGIDREAFADKAPLLLFLATLGLVFSTVESLGEELGWRGFLVPELARTASFTRTAMVSGGIWCLWHYPAFFFLAYHGEAPRSFELVSLTLQLMAGSFILAWLRLKSGSVWTAAIFHGTHNLYVQTILDPITTDRGLTHYIVGEFGIGLVIAWVVVAYIFWRLRGRLPSPELSRSFG